MAEVQSFECNCFIKHSLDEKQIQSPKTSCAKCASKLQNCNTISKRVKKPPEEMNAKQHHWTNSKWVNVFDKLVGITIVSPLVVGYWRGTWQLMDLYMYTEDFELSVWTSFIFGTASVIFFTIIQVPLSNLFRPERSFLWFFYASRVYAALFGVAVVNQWRGVWGLLDCYTGTSPYSSGGSFLLGIFALATWRGLRNIIAAPMVIVTDSPTDYFKATTRFKQKAKKISVRFILDVWCSVGVLGSLTVFVWRGCWGLLDVVLFPNDALLSYYSSLVLGCSVTIVVFLVEPLAVRTSKGLGFFNRILFEDIFLFLGYFGPVNVWRGCWNLYDYYLYPDNYELSNWVTHGSSFLILMLMYCLNSILVRGFCIDGELEGGKGCYMETAYIARIFMPKMKNKVEHVGLTVYKEIVPLNGFNGKEEEMNAMVDQNNISH